MALTTQLQRVRFSKTPTILNDGWVINLTEPKQTKWRKIMSLFKRKKRQDAWSNTLTEQQYIDQHIEALGNRIDYLMDEVEILKMLKPTEHIFVGKGGSFYNKITETNMYENESREWLKENGYSYMKTFKVHGELWIKEGKKNEKKEK